MTVNERLYVSGLLTDYDEAVKKRDSRKVQEILERLQIGEGSINEILCHANEIANDLNVGHADPLRQ